jgi:transposase
VIDRFAFFNWEAGMTVLIVRQDHTGSEFRLEAARSKDAAYARRTLALALVLEGTSRKIAAETCGMDRQTLRDWVYRYNAEGLAGLYDRPPAGGPIGKLTKVQTAELADWVRTGPDLKEDKIVRWRRRDLQQRIAARFHMRMHQRRVGKLLARLNFSHISVRPRHPQADAEAQAAHKKRMGRPVRKRFQRSDPGSLRQRIRPVGRTPAKMEIRAPWSP